MDGGLTANSTVTVSLWRRLARMRFLHETRRSLLMPGDMLTALQYYAGDPVKTAKSPKSVIM